MRPTASILHLDLDAFFASVEQRDKPSLRGKPVVVGGLGARGVVSTASYEARPFGVHSAMPMHEARRLCPQAAFLSGRFGAYRVASRQVMTILRELSPLVEPLSLDEAYVDLAAGGITTTDVDELRALAESVRARVREATGGLRSSIGIASSKFLAKIASERAKPNGVVVIAPGTERDVIAPLPVRDLPGVGPATAERLHRLGVATVADLRTVLPGELRHELGQAAATWLTALSIAEDNRPVASERDVKSISVEDTFERDLTTIEEVEPVIVRDVHIVAGRLRRSGLFARTITLKLKSADFTTHTRSRTLLGATDREETMTEVARSLLAEQAILLPSGVRLAGVGVSNFTTVAQETLFEARFDGQTGSVTGGATGHDHSGDGRRDGANNGEVAPAPEALRTDGSDESHDEAGPPLSLRHGRHRYSPGDDVVHRTDGPGWVWGAGLGRVTVRFETAETPPGPIRTFAEDDPELSPAPVVVPAEAEVESGPGWAVSESVGEPGDDHR
ncbi:MAG: DNA polymerase IV [Propionibacteriaceae bacterium]|jgi:DNA polymerase-4|nr:DNA polymerase IV [Propionibacteriaceae bacterium]